MGFERLTVVAVKHGTEGGKQLLPVDKLPSRGNGGDQDTHLGGETGGETGERDVFDGLGLPLLGSKVKGPQRLRGTLP